MTTSPSETQLTSKRVGRAEADMALRKALAEPTSEEVGTQGGVFVQVKVETPSGAFKPGRPAQQGPNVLGNLTIDRQVRRVIVETILGGDVRPQTTPKVPALKWAAAVSLVGPEADKDLGISRILVGFIHHVRVTTKTVHFPAVNKAQEVAGTSARRRS